MNTSTTMTIKKTTKDNLDKYKERHRELKTYDEVIKHLLDERKEKLNFDTWDLNYIDREIMKYIQSGINIAQGIKSEFLKNNYPLSFQTVEKHLIDLTEKKFLIKTEGRPATYKINSEIVE